MKKMGFFLIVLSSVLSGCVTLQTSGPAKMPHELATIGMTRDRVTALMSHPVVVGVEIDPATGATKPVEAPSLYSTEFLSKNQTTYVVDLYILKTDVTSVKSPGEETLPFIFENNLLIGKGQDALKALQEK